MAPRPRRTSECPLEHDGPGLHRFRPVKCAHLGDEWIALERHGSGAVSFTAHWGDSRAVIFTHAAKTWEGAEEALRNGGLATYVEALTGRRAPDAGTQMDVKPGPKPQKKAKR